MSNRRTSHHGEVVSIEIDGKEISGMVRATPPRFEPGFPQGRMSCPNCQSMQKRIRELEKLNNTLHKKVRKLKGGKRR